MNAGQVGAGRAGEKIHLRKLCQEKEDISDEIKQALGREAEEFAKLPVQAAGNMALGELWKKASMRMSACGGMIRNRESLETALEETNEELEHYLELVTQPAPSQLPLFYRLRDMLVARKA